MKKFLKVFLGIFISFLIVFSYSSIVNATTAVSGWAWSSTIGWISFNNTTGGGTTNYGVNIEPDGNMIGHAWSENIGWIDFDPAGPFPTGGGTVATSSRVDLDGTVCGDIGRVCGWAKALAHGGGWDGWISMRGTIVGHPDYGVWLDTAPTPNEFRGWAWGDDVVGWISFNHGNPLPPGFVDTPHVYQVTTTFDINAPPTATGLAATLPDPCAGNFWTFSWTFTDPDGDAQSVYQVQVATSTANLDAGILVINTTASSTVSSGATSSYASLTPLKWNTTYYWRVRVWDAHNLASVDWINGPSFTTPAHRYPEPSFTFTPPAPVAGEEIIFNAGASACFDIDGICDVWFWEFGDGATSTGVTTTHTFAEIRDYTVTLTVTDGSGFACSDSQTIGVLSPLEWIEVPPIIWLRRVLARVTNVFNNVWVQ